MKPTYADMLLGAWRELQHWMHTSPEEAFAPLMAAVLVGCILLVAIIVWIVGIFDDAVSDPKPREKRD